MCKLRMIMIVLYILILSCNCNDKQGKPVNIPVTKVNAVIKVNMDNVHFDKRIPNDIAGDFIGLINKDNIVLRNRTAATENRQELWVLKPYEEKIYKKFHIERGSIQSPSGSAAPLRLAKLNNLVIISDLRKIMVFDKDFNWQLSQMVHNLTDPVDFFILDNKYSYLHYELIPSHDTAAIYLNTYSFNPFSKTKKPKKIRTIYSCKKEYFSRHRINNKIRIKGIWDDIYSFEKGGKIFYSDNKTKILNIYNLKSNQIRKIDFEYLKGKVFDENNLTLDNFIVRDRTEKSKKLAHKNLKLMHSQKSIYHFGIIDGGSNYIGIFSNLNIKDWRIQLDFFNIDDKDNISYYKSIKIPIPYSIQGASAFNNPTALFEILLNVKKKFICYTSFNNDVLNKTPTIMYFGEEK